jgi:general secretion pathway protein D
MSLRPASLEPRAARRGGAQFLGAALAGLLCFGGPLAAQQPARTPTLVAATRSDAPPAAPAEGWEALRQQLLQRGDLTLRDIALHEAMFTIGEIWGVNMVVGADVDGKVNGVFKNAPLHEVLDAVLVANGYGYRPVGKSLVVMKADQLTGINPMFESVAIPCPHSSPKDVVEVVKLLLSPQGRVEPIEAPAGRLAAVESGQAAAAADAQSTGSIVVFDFPDRVAAVRKFVADLQSASLGNSDGPAGRTPPQVKTFTPQYLSAKALRDSVQSVLSAQGKVSVLDPENQLVVLDQPSRLELVRQIMEQLDRPRTQVRITALIYDISLEDMEQLGINWRSVVKGRYDAAGNPQTAFTIDSVMQTPPVPGDINGVFTFMNLSRNFDLTAVVQALQTCKDSRLLSNPNVTTLENEEATISIVTEIPYQQLTQTQQGGNIGTTAFREAGVKLVVTPRIADDETIQLTVKPSFSRLTGFTPGPTPQPIIDKREEQTVVRVANQQTLVIGGLRARRDIGEFTGIPGLKDIKYVGKLFRARDTSMQETELVVFLRPELVDEYYQGLPREVANRELTDALLDNIPVAVGPKPCLNGPADCPPPTQEQIDRGLRSRPEHPEPIETPRAVQERRGAPGAGAARRGAGYESLTRPTARSSARRTAPSAPRSTGPPPRAGTARPAQPATARPAPQPAAPAPLPPLPELTRTRPAPAAAQPKPEPNAWERLFGSREHPEGAVARREPVRVPHPERFQGGTLRPAAPQLSRPAAPPPQPAPAKEPSWWDKLWR